MQENLKAFATLVGTLLAQRWHRACQEGTCEKAREFQEDKRHDGMAHPNVAPLRRARKA